MPPGTACDECHRRKERCLFDAAQGQCGQCQVHQRRCSFGRQSRRIGRPPVVRKLPYGCCEVLRFDVSSTPPPQTEPAAAMPRAPASPLLDSDTEGPHRPLAASPPSEPPTTPELRTSALSPPTSSLAGLGDFVDAPDSNATRPSALAQHGPLHEVLSDPQVFYAFHRKFMMGPSFSDSFRQAVMTVLESSDGAVLDAYTTVLALWDVPNEKVKSLSDVDLSRGTHCLKRLQTPAIAHPRDAAAVVMLGQILVVYHIIALGTSAHAILRRSLLLVKAQYPELLAIPSLHTITITPILTDTLECLVRRELPVVAVPDLNSSDDAIVDRTAGLCLGLVRLQQDICRIGHRAKVLAMIVDNDGPASPTDQHVGPYRQELDDLRRRVSHWEPRPPLGFFTAYSRFEVSAMMMQARVYRLATLLVIHRLQYPLGTEDEHAARLAMAIAAELECFVSWAPQEVMGTPIGFPLFMTLIELGHVSEDIIRYMTSPYNAVPGYVDKLKAFVQLVKAARDSGFCGLWFDLADDHLAIPVLP